MLELIRFEIAAEVAKAKYNKGKNHREEAVEGLTATPNHPVGMLVMLTVKYIFN
jgi:hypothetical protein